MNKSGPVPQLNGVSNVYVFVSDAMRWDYLPARLANMGMTFKTISASLTTASSFPSIVTGVYPPKHGVYSWNDQIPNIESLLNYPGFESGYTTASEDSDDGTYSVLNQTPRSFKELDSPWLAVERDYGGHAPFDSLENVTWNGYDEFVAEFAGKSELLKDYYEQAIEKSVERFERRIDELESRGMLDQTLIIFCSDHGEALGEDGMVGHNFPALPGTVYVPTIFIHPDIKKKGIQQGIIRHVDYFPTVLSTFEEDIPEHIDGIDLSQTQPSSGYCYCQVDHQIRQNRITVLKSSSVWDENGGHILSQENYLKRILIIGYLMGGKKRKSIHLRNSPQQIASVVRKFLSSKSTHGNPGFSFEQAVEQIKEIENQPKPAETRSQSLDSETKENLRELGYL